MSAVNQVLGVRTEHLNGGHYQVQTNSNLDLVLENFTQYCCAENREDALANCQPANLYGNPTELDLEISQPLSGTAVTQGEVVNLWAEVVDDLDEVVSYPVQAVITYHDVITDGQPYQETFGVPYDSTSLLGDTDYYKLEWVPLYAGKVSIAMTADAITVEDSDQIGVNVSAQSADLTVTVSDLLDVINKGETIEVVTWVANMGGVVNQIVPIRFEYYFFETTVLEQGAQALTTSRWVEEVTHVKQENLTLGGYGATQVVTDNFTVPKTGVYRVKVTVDPE